MILIHGPRQFSFNSPRKRTGSEFQNIKIHQPNNNSTVFHISPVFQLLNLSAFAKKTTVLTAAYDVLQQYDMISQLSFLPNV